MQLGNRALWTRLRREELRRRFDWVAQGHDREHLLQVTLRAAYKRPEEKSPDQPEVAAPDCHECEEGFG